MLRSVARPRATASICGVRSEATTWPACGASARATWPAPVAISSADQAGWGASNSTSRGRLPPLAWERLVA